MSRMKAIRALLSKASGVQRIPLLKSVLMFGQSLADKNVTLVAGGVAFYAFLSLFPAIICIIFLWELFASDANAFVLLGFLEHIVPEQAFNVIADLIFQITEREEPASIWAATISMVIALWSSSRAVEALLVATHIMYRNPYKRGVIKQRAIALVFTFLGLLFTVLSVLLIGALPPVLHAMNLGGATEHIVLLARWVFILLLFAIGAYAFYFTSRKPIVTENQKARNRLIPGTLGAAMIWLIVSVAFSYALANFVTYHEGFGSLGAIAALMMWLWLSAISLLIGAEINTGFDGRLAARFAASAMDEAATIPPSE